MKKLILTTALATVMAFPALADTKVMVFKDGAAQERMVRDYDTAPGMALVRPEMEYEGYTALTEADYGTLTADDLDDATVYGANNESVGEIDELLLAADGKTIDRVVIEVGGFLGIGEREVAVPFDRLNVLRNADGDFRIYIDSTEERLEALPEYEEIE